MADIRSVKSSGGGASDEYVEQLRQKIGTEFSDRKATGKKKNELGKDDFIKLMSAQLKHQDPINPLKNEEMAAQLAQFAALEQMTNMNQNIEKMAAAQKPGDNVLAASLIGKRVGTDSSRFLLEQGGQPEMKFDMPRDAENVSVSIVDAKGEVIREFDLGAMAAGGQSLRWDGKNGKSQPAQAGEYTFRVNAIDKNNTAVPVQTSSYGLVSGVSFESGKAMLLVDGKKIPLEAVGRIEADTPAAAKPLTGGAGAPAGATASELMRQVKKDLPPGLDAEKIKSMLGSLGGASRMETAPANGESSNENSPMPLWNPSL